MLPAVRQLKNAMCDMDAWRKRTLKIDQSEVPSSKIIEVRVLVEVKV